MLGELQALLQYQYDRIDFIDEPVDVGFDCPLDLHCTYTRDQLLVALDFLKPATVREGVKWLPEKQLDVFFVTLNKADKDYSPTTMYKDYSINESLFNWQSQSTTAESSATGQRYIHHREKEAVCCYSCVSSRQMPVLAVQERIPICARCNQPIKRVKLKDGSIMQAAEFAAPHEGMCADCYKATRLNVA